MYQKYTTRGFLISARASGEADKIFGFYTEEFGLIFAKAISVRSGKSKLRPHIREGALLAITVIQSKTGFKLVEVSMISTLKPRSSAYVSFLRSVQAVKALVFGEERNQSLFDTLMGEFEYLSVHDSSCDFASVECLAMLKILHALGYGEPKNNMEYEKMSFDKESVELIATDRSNLITAINKALTVTGL